LSIAGAVEQAGYQAQRISLDENTARVLAGPPKRNSDSWSELVELNLYRTDSGWSLFPNPHSLIPVPLLLATGR